MKLSYKESDKDSRFLMPASEGGGVIDVVNDMAWTETPKNSPIRKNVPYALLTEYQQTTGQIIASTIYYTRILGNTIDRGAGSLLARDDASEVYKYKYFGEPTGFSYKIPYFNPKKLSRSNEFDYSGGTSPFSKLLELGAQKAGFGKNGGVSWLASMTSWLSFDKGVIDAFLPGKLGFELPNAWTTTAPETYDFTFDLSNSGTVEDIENNRNLCHILSHQNSPSRRNFAIIDPPAIYSLFIPDVVNMPVGYINNLEITNLGNTRVMYFPSSDGTVSVPRTIPEAYRIHITMTSLLMPTRNMTLAMDKGSKVEAISDITPFRNATDLFARNAAEGFKNPENVRLLRRALEDVDDHLSIQRGTSASNILDPNLGQAAQPQ